MPPLAVRASIPKTALSMGWSRSVPSYAIGRRREGECHGYTQSAGCFSPDDAPKNGAR